MSTTVCIALSAKPSETSLARLQLAAEERDYAIRPGIENAEDDAREGIGEAAGHFGWHCCLLLVAPADGKGALAFGIQEELRRWETEGARPPFFSFMEEVHRILGCYYDEYWYLFSGEWYAGDRIRLRCGSVSDLEALLATPGNWYERLYVVRTGRFQDSDETPVVFRITEKEKRRVS